MHYVYKWTRAVSIGLISGTLFLENFFFPSHCLAKVSEVRPKGTNVYQMVTGDDLEEDRRRWDKIYSIRAYIFGKEPSPFLKESVHFPEIGHGLDIAMGEGRNAIFLAKKGFQVEGVDISEVALRKAKRLARENRVNINTILADLTTYTIKPDAYHVILNFNYLQRSLIPQLKRGLKKGGMIIYENYTLDQLRNQNGQNLPRDLLLAKDELKELFKDFEILLYRETNDGRQAKVQMVARKP